MSLNNAISPKFLFLKNFLLTALRIKSCFGISKPLVLLGLKNSLFSTLFFNSMMFVLYYGGPKQYLFSLLSGD